MGRSNSFDKQNNVGLIYNKLETRLNEISKLMQQTLSNFEVMVSKNLNQPHVTRNET